MDKIEWQIPAQQDTCHIKYKDWDNWLLHPVRKFSALSNCAWLPSKIKRSPASIFKSGSGFTLTSSFLTIEIITVPVLCRKSSFFKLFLFATESSTTR